MSIYIWLVVYLPLWKYESQWEGLSHVWWKIQKMFQTTNQIYSETFAVPCFISELWSVYVKWTRFMVSSFSATILIFIIIYWRPLPFQNPSSSSEAFNLHQTCLLEIMEIHRFSGFPSSKFDDADLQPISPQCPLMGGSVHTEEGQVTAAMRRMPRDLKVATCRGTGRPQLCSGKPYRNETMSEKGCEDMCRTLSLSPCSYNVLSMYYMDAYIYIHTIINISLYIINYNHRANGLQE